MIGIEKIKKLALDGDLYAVQELITRLESAESSNKQWEDSYHSQQEYFLERTTAMQAKLEAAEQDASLYQFLASQATQQADTLGPIFRIDIRRGSEATLFNFYSAVSEAMKEMK